MEVGRSASALGSAAMGNAHVLAESFSLREPNPEQTGLDSRVGNLVRVAALIALDAPPAAYGAHVADALKAGATIDEVIGVLRTIAPLVGSSRVVAAAPELLLALGLELPEDSC